MVNVILWKELKNIQEVILMDNIIKKAADTASNVAGNVVQKTGDIAAATGRGAMKAGEKAFDATKAAAGKAADATVAGAKDRRQRRRKDRR